MRIFNILKKFLSSPYYRFCVFTDLGLTHYFSLRDDVKFLKKKFKLAFEYDLDLENPQTFNEKLQWLKLYDRKPEYTIMVDKYLAKKYVADKIGEEYIIPTLGVWDDPDDIDFDKLPNQFVLKCNHNSGLGMCICKDKSKLNIQKVKAELRKGLKQDYYWPSREWPYKDVQKKIIAEQYMGENLTDYKFLCFNGRPEIIEIHRDRFTDYHTQSFYDMNWAPTDITQTDAAKFDGIIPKPATFELMVNFSNRLSQSIPHIRVDWYEIDSKLYFGELTFFDSGGFGKFSKNEYDRYLGSLIKLQ